MFSHHELARVLGLACAVLVAQAALAQTAPAAKRQRVDVRSMVPGPQAAEAAAEAKAASGLTPTQRKEAALQARQEGSLQPAGEAADLSSTKPAPMVAEGPGRAPATASLAPQPEPAAAPAAAAQPTLVAAAPPTAPKKRKKARAASAPA